MSEANPYGKTPEEIDRSNRWFRVAVALGKQDDYTEMLKTERRMASEQTERDAQNRAWFNSGWEACRREVLAIAEHQDAEAAVDWASRHPAGRHELYSAEVKAPADPAGHAEQHIVVTP